MILLHHRMKQVRTILHMTQKEFAKHLGITQNAYSMIENNVRPLSDKYIKLVSRTFNINESWIYTGEGDMFTASPYETELITIFQQLDYNKQLQLLHIAKELLEKQNASSQQ